MEKYNDISRTEIKEWITESPGQTPSNEEIEQAEAALLNYATAHSLAPPAHLREQILAKLMTMNTQAAQRKNLSMSNLPMLADHSNWLDWEEVVEGIEPPDEFEEIHLHPIETNEKRELFVAWVKEMVPEEVHYDLLESFLILEGSCECHITNEVGETRIVRLGQGDFITMQLGETHDIVITSLKPAKAILEWRKIAA